jgi:hypothetical protein
MTMSTCPQCKRIPLPLETFPDHNDHCGCLYPYCVADRCNRGMETGMGFCRRCADKDLVLLNGVSLLFTEALTQWQAMEFVQCKTLMQDNVSSDLISIVCSYLKKEHTPTFAISRIPYSPRADLFPLDASWLAEKTQQIGAALMELHCFAFAPPALTLIYIS